MKTFYSNYLRSVFPQYQKPVASWLLLIFSLTSIPAISYTNKKLFTELAFASAPVLTAETYKFSISETAALGATVGSIKATDPDGNTVKYTIHSGNTNKTFAINTTTGAITVAKQLVYHAQSSYSLTVRATDPGGLYDAATVAITVTRGPSVSTFSTISWGTAANQPYKVNEAQGKVVNGKLYTFGGFDSQKSCCTPTSRAYVYDPVGNKWSAIAPMPPMNGTTYGGVTHSGFATDGTDIYFAGGYTSNATGTGQIFGTKEAWKYIVAENRYVRLPDLPVVISAGQLEYVNGKLHHIAGTNQARTQDLGNHYVLNLDNLGAGWTTKAALPNPRQHAGSAVYEGKIYFIGGQTGHDSKLITSKEVHRYDPVANTWTKVADLPVPSGANGRGHISSSVTVVGNRVFVFGGETVHSTSRTSMVSAYTPATNTWSNLTSLPASRYSGVAGYLNNAIFYTGGSSSSTTYKGTPGGTTSTQQQVVSFTLINADNEQAIQTLTSGATLNLATLPTKNLNIRANTNPTTVGSVVFNLSGTQTKTVTESRAPYALYGDNMNGDYYAWTPAVGSYTLKGTPYTASGGGGTAGTSLTVNFTVTNQATASTQVSPAVAAEEPKAHQITVYPNPNSGDGVHIAIENFARHEPVTVTMYDLLGRLIKSIYIETDEQGGAHGDITADLPKTRGVYSIIVSARSGKAQARLIIE